MDLENIRLDFTAVNPADRRAVSYILDNFPLKGGANYPTFMGVLASNPVENESGRIVSVSLSPLKFKKDLRFFLNFSSLPSGLYVTENFFGGSNNPPSTVVTELSEPNGMECEVLRRYHFYPGPAS